MGNKGRKYPADSKTAISFGCFLFQKLGIYFLLTLSIMRFARTKFSFAYITDPAAFRIRNFGGDNVIN
jgi:hypothetical protein